jgi:hypothetical protein
MGDFVDAALSFPAAIFIVLLAIVVIYWLLVLIGTLDVEIGDLDLADGIGLGGVPATISFSVLTVAGWFVSLVGTVMMEGVLTGVLRIAVGIGVIVGALTGGLFAAGAVAKPLRKLYVTGGAASRGDFVGRECVIRTGTVTGDFGQAEATAADGSSAIIQVRQTGEHALTHGDRALIFDYDTDGEFFWVAPAT